LKEDEHHHNDGESELDVGQELHYRGTIPELFGFGNAKYAKSLIFQAFLMFA
jgi:hypothetical protein